MRDDPLRNVIDGLKNFENLIAGRAVAGLTDINQVSEDFVADFLNELRELNLENVNRERSNHPAIDLADRRHRVAYQVTTTKTSRKIQDTIDGFIDHRLNEIYDDLYVLILGKKQTTYSAFDAKGTNFDPDKHIIDLNWLIREVSCGQTAERLRNLERLIVLEGLIGDQSPTSAIERASDSTIQRRSWASDRRFRSLATACLIGQWIESSAMDRVAIAQLLPCDYSVWLQEMRSLLQEADSPVALKNGHWRVIDRGRMWNELSACIFDEDLERFQLTAIEVLSETDPDFELPVHERIFKIRNQEDNLCSDQIRRGIAESITYMAQQGDRLRMCSQHKASMVAVAATREILSSDDYRLWGSLNMLLPFLAEAAPNDFLTAVERVLSIEQSPFGELFQQEQGGVFAPNYVTGLLWGLESLAWEESHLIRASVILGMLAAIDPGGQYSNRPSNSLTEIFLPWFPQTLASFDRQITALETLRREQPGVLSDLLLSLLPKQRTTTGGTHRPIYLELTKEQKSPRFNPDEYRSRIAKIADLALDVAKVDLRFLMRFAEEIDHLPKDFRDRFIAFLRSKDGQSLIANDRSKLWEIFESMARRHRKFSGANWALPAEEVNMLDEYAKEIASKDPIQSHQWIFNHDEYDLDNDSGDWDECRRNLHEQRSEAISQIMADEGIRGVVVLGRSVENPNVVGYAFGRDADSRIDGELFPEILRDPVDTRFVGGYAHGRIEKESHRWIDSLDKTAWTRNELLQLLLVLPFGLETWGRVPIWLEESESDYWCKVKFNPYQARADLPVAVNRLIDAGRPIAAIDCLHCMLRQKEPLDVQRTIRALMAAVSSSEETARHDQYELIRLIEALQDEPSVDEYDLSRIEWAYLRLLDPFSSGRPRTLYRKMSLDALFFCEVLRLVYKSENASDENQIDDDESRKMIAENARHLLHDWDRAPGVDDSGELVEETFKTWVDVALDECRKSGHWGIGLDLIGKALFHCPAEKDGSLWIACVAAELLNRSLFDDMRKGFTCEAANSRGTHTPSVDASMELKDRWMQRADDVDDQGYFRFAAELRSFADYYQLEADRIVDEHWDDSID